VNKLGHTSGSLFRTRILPIVLLAAAAGSAVDLQYAHGGTLAAVSPMGASPSVAVSITGTGFNATAANNVVTFIPASGSAVTTAATAVTTLSAATGLRRLTVTVPAGLPIGTAALRVLNTPTGETSAGRSLEVIEISLLGVSSAAVGASNVNVRITGSPNTAFAAGSTRATFGAGVTVNSTAVESANSLVANVSVSPTAAVGARAVGVINNTQTALRAQAFSVIGAAANRPPTWSPLDGPTLNEGDTLDLQLAASDPDEDPLILTILGLPAFASFVDAGNGTATLSLLPRGGHAGTYNLTATATDSKGAATSFVLPVIVIDGNGPPAAAAQQVTVAEDNSIALTLTGSDPDEDPITFSVTAGPTHGSLSGSPPALLYTPSADYFGPDEFEFTAHDASSSSEPATVAVNVTEVNDAPILRADTATLKYVGTLPGIPPRPVCRTPCGIIYGDPHILSYDRADFDVQAVGEVIATKSTTDDFEVQARFAPVPNLRTVSIAVAVAMRVNGHRVTMYRTIAGYEARIDGTPVTLSDAPQLLPGGGTIGKYGTSDSVFVTWPDGTVVIARAVGIYPEYYRFVVEVGLPPSRVGRVVGILADANGNAANDIVTRGGVELTFPDPPFATFYGTYVNSWRVSMAETLFDYGAGQSTDTFTDLSYPDAPATPQTLPPAALARATAVCAQFGLTSTAVHEACLVDVGITGDADFATEAAAAQAASLGLPNNAGSSAIGAPTTVTIDTPGAMAVRTFPGIAGQRLTLTVTSNSIAGADLRVRDPSGGTVTNLFVSAATGFREVFTLPTTGTYTITIDPRDDLVGTLTFELGDVPDNDGVTTIGTPTTVTIATIGEVAVRSFTATAGQKVTLTAIGNTIPGVDLLVRQPNGGSLTNLFASGPTAFRDTFTLPVTGTYTIAVDPREQLVGTVTFTLNAVPDNAGETALDAPTTVTIATIGEVAVRSFAATAGQKVTLTATGNTIPGVDLFVRQPNGGSLINLFASGQTGFRDTFTLPVTGTYTIAVDPREQLVGTVTFTVNAVPDNTGVTALDAPTTVSIGTIGEVAERSFTATAGQKVTLTATGNTIPGVDLFVRQPNGGSLINLFVSGPTGFRDTFTLPVTGTYTIAVDPREQLLGTVTFTLNAVPENTGATAIGTSTTVTIGTIGETAVRTFAATAGQSVTISVTGNTIAGVDLLVRLPNGGSLINLFVSGPTGFRPAFTLPVTGTTYTITVDPRGQLVGTLTFTLNEATP
jgi:hypothetical protein